MVLIRRTVASIYIFTLLEITTKPPCSFLLLLYNMQFEINYVIILFYVEIISFTAHVEKLFYHNYTCSWYSDYGWAGKSGAQIPATNFSLLQSIQIGFGAHPASCWVGTRVLSLG